MPDETPHAAELTLLLPVTREWSRERFCTALGASDVPRGRLVLILDAPGCEEWEGALTRLGFSVETHATGNGHPPQRRGDRRPRHRAMRRLSQTLVPDGPLLCLEDDTLVPPDIYARLSAAGPNATGVQAGRHESHRTGVDGARKCVGVEKVRSCGHYCLLTTGEAYRHAKIRDSGPVDSGHTLQIRPLVVDWGCACGHLTESGVLYAAPATPRSRRGGRQSIATPVDFVVVSYNSTRETGRLLLQLAMTYPGEHTVTVVDNSRENRGFARASNMAAAQGSSPIIAFLNPDIVLAPGWADETIAALMSDPGLAIAGPRLDDGIPWPRDVSSRGLKSWVCGACYFVRREFFDRAGGFDERYYFSFEETDLCRQAEQAGLRVQTIGEPRVKHLRHDTPFHKEQFRIAAKKYAEKWG